MDAKMIIISSFSSLYGILEIFMGIIQKSKAVAVRRDDNGSFWVLFISIFIGYSLAFRLAEVMTGDINYWESLGTGATLVIIGLTIRIHSILILRQYFTYTVARIQNHELIDKGLYKRIRHPGYLGQLIIFFGISVSLSAWLSVVTMMVPIFIGYHYRIHVEEKFMANQFGEKYHYYQKKTKRLIPKVY